MYMWSGQAEWVVCRAYWFWNMKFLFIFFCFQLDKIFYIFETLSPILMVFSAKQSSLITLTNKLQIWWNLTEPDIRLVSLDRITYIIHKCSWSIIHWQICTLSHLIWSIVHHKLQCTDHLVYKIDRTNSKLIVQ